MDGRDKNLFFDTYALYEIINGNPTYKDYEKEIAIITSKLNLMKLHYGMLLLHGKEKADEYYEKFLEFAVEIEDGIIKMANYFRAEHKKRKLSYVDYIGYIIAKLRNIKFLTGDIQFQDLENVQFVK